MRATPHRLSTGPDGPTLAHSPQDSFVGTALLVAGFLLAMAAAFAPAFALGALGGALAARPLGRGLAALRRARRRRDRTRAVCVPGTDVCVEA